MSKLKLSRYEPIFPIGLAAGRIGVSVPTLRMYERRGLVLPHKTGSGRRYYSIHDLELLLCVRTLLTKEGLNIEGIRRLMALVPCWKLRPCSREERELCPAYRDSSAPCWDREGTVCRNGGGICRECNAYRKLPECTSMKAMKRR